MNHADGWAIWEGSRRRLRPSIANPPNGPGSRDPLGPVPDPPVPDPRARLGPSRPAAAPRPIRSSGASARDCRIGGIGGLTVSTSSERRAPTLRSAPHRHQSYCGGASPVCQVHRPRPRKRPLPARHRRRSRARVDRGSAPPGRKADRALIRRSPRRHGIGRAGLRRGPACGPDADRAGRADRIRPHPPTGPASGCPPRPSAAARGASPRPATPPGARGCRAGGYWRGRPATRTGPDRPAAGSGPRSRGAIA